MKVQPIVIAITSLFGVSIAHAQYYYQPPPGYAPPPGPPPGYVVPPPPPGPPGPGYWAPAPSGQGPYFRAGIGPSFFQDGLLKGFSIGGSSPFTGPTGNVKYNVGVSGYGAAGFAFNRYVALDFELGYTWASIDSVQNYSVNNSSIGNLPFLANATFSLPIPHSNVIPYIGGGVGGSDSIFDAHSMLEPVSGNFVDGSESDVVFAWQAFAGVRFQIDPNISVGIGYNYFMTGNPTFSYPPGPNLNVVFRGVRTHTVMFTFQANF